MPSGPKSHLDWLGVVTLWLGALILAIKSGGLELPHGAPPFLASGLWNYAPVALISVAGAIFVYRALRPVPSAAAIALPVASASFQNRHALTGEMPTIALEHAMKIMASSRWAAEHGANTEACIREMRDKLAAHNLTAFGRRNKNAVIEAIPAHMWPSMTLDVDLSAAIMSESLEGVFSDIQFDKDKVLLLWPSARRHRI